MPGRSRCPWRTCRRSSTRSSSPFRRSQVRLAPHPACEIRAQHRRPLLSHHHRHSTDLIPGTRGDAFMLTFKTSPFTTIESPISSKVLPVQTCPRAAETELPRDNALWAVVLAGGESVRLRSLMSRLYGDARPKQYAALLDSRTLLNHTLDRVSLLVPPERTVVVTVQNHDRYIAGDFEGPAGPHVLWQPENQIGRASCREQE